MHTQGHLCCTLDPASEQWRLRKCLRPEVLIYVDFEPVKLHVM